MRETVNDGNIFLLPSPFKKDACLVTTNGIIRANGKAVMGAGIAKYCRDTFKGVDDILAKQLRQGGNHVYYLGLWPLQSINIGSFMLFSFPTKDDWRDNSKLELIAQSCKEIRELVDKYELDHIYMPCPGCSNGKLDYWNDVRPILRKELDDRFNVNIPNHIMRKKPKEVMLG